MERMVDCREQAEERKRGEKKTDYRLKRREIGGGTPLGRSDIGRELNP